LPKLACVAGEPSGDLLAAPVLSALNQIPDMSGLEVYGIGGPLMQAEGMRSDWSMNILSVRGYVEAIKQLPAILKLRKELIQHLLNEGRPDVYLGIDAPDFNLKIEKQCRQMKIPTVHYISPSIWAWRYHRINGIKKAVDHMLCIFPFEPKIYHDVGMQATYVGHPLANKIPMKPNPANAKLELSSKGLLQYGPISLDETIIAVLPGSRESEIKYIAKGFFEAMTIMQKTHGKSIRFLTPVATELLRPELEKLKKEALIKSPDIKIELITENSSLILESADSVLIASGTATLEAALWKKPMVISYSVPWLTAQIMKRQGYLPYVGLPNILCQSFVVPELLQEQAVPEVLARGTLEWLDRPQQVESLVSIFEELHDILKKPTEDLVAEAIAQTINLKSK